MVEDGCPYVRLDKASLLGRLDDGFRKKKYDTDWFEKENGEEGDGFMDVD
jgi:hypothetical protein